MKGFDPSKIITNPEELFGRNILLEQLTTHTRRNNIVQVIGVRRYGKTSLLKCLESKIMREFPEKILPFYIDFKEEGAMVKGTGNVYRYLISRICQRLTKERILDSNIIIKNVTISPCQEWEDCFEKLENVKDVRIQGLFKEIVCWFSEFSERTFYFLFDEYEHLFRFTFDSPEGFMTMRSLSSHSLSNGQIPFGFIISGTLTFEYLCTITGSGELNVVSDTIYVPPIDKEYFVKMWKYEVARVSNLDINLLEEIDFFYNASGGVPFYGKLLAESWIISKVKPDYSKLKPFFEEVFLGLSKGERGTLENLSPQSLMLPVSVHRDDLFRKGIIGQNGKEFYIKSTFFNEFISSKKSAGQEKSTDSSIGLISKTVISINSLITKINDTCKNKRKEYIFEPTNDDAALILDLQMYCSTSDTFSNFSNSLYKIIFERTKGSSKHNAKGESLWRLPDSFKKGNKFINVVDIMRHSLGGAHLMGTFTQRNGKMTKSEMLELLTGTRNEPHAPEEYIQIQIATLIMFEKELQNLFTLIKS